MELEDKVALARKKVVELNEALVALYEQGVRVELDIQELNRVGRVSQYVIVPTFLKAM